MPYRSSRTYRKGVHLADVESADRAHRHRAPHRTEALPGWAYVRSTPCSSTMSAKAREVADGPARLVVGVVDDLLDVVVLVLPVDVEQVVADVALRPPQLCAGGGRTSSTANASRP